ncbi:type I-E CRISPR-associated protein Cas6/Cse3/CasE [Lipingzhangella sp. LS1_29]|uniref:Type I-E CRISPR-associated protein Cas6/Cse3/CasE n=1 Tax=Lipingzhangella rawalii TaxID=2055835 RepID=A0ABU2H5G0_9ACTN|nr:type I-E CRISPR-associated protein Cas6/Cse3/CasE [Lipingzhangella rawalii]MDS1270533.1 type I-E CRISPR-associated protein Cas6/Cse3/CasE [Lipingzhangella rawalii]
MFLSKLSPNVSAHAFRRDYANVHDMHRTIMSAFPKLTEGTSVRREHGVLWRMETSGTGYTLLVQSCTEPDWTQLPKWYLRAPAQVRSLQPVLDAIQPGRVMAFRLVANPTRARAPVGSPPGNRPRGVAKPLYRPEDQISWLLRKGEQHGFIVPSGSDRRPDVAPAPVPKVIGYKQVDGHESDRACVREGGRLGRTKITISPVRFNGHLVVTDSTALVEALCAGIGRGKAFGCGLLSLAPAQNY